MNTRKLLTRLPGIALTTALGLLSLLILWHFYAYYTYAPQTRDGKLRADVVALAADVSGRVEQVLVHDNQTVDKGQVLFVIDTVRLGNNLNYAQAQLRAASTRVDAAAREFKRYSKLKGVIAPQELDIRISALEEARANFAQAQAQEEKARIDLERARVRAPVNGKITNFSLRPGEYATAGQPVMVLVDNDSYYVAGYFEETKLPYIHEGAHAVVHLMGEDRELQGHVEGLSAGIADRERSADGSTLLANVNPTFSWVRLAQRVPVRITLDHVPDNVTLIAGRTATVTLDGADLLNAPWTRP